VEVEMRFRLSGIVIILFGLGFLSGELFGQYIEDAVRYSNPNGIITPRAAGLGISYAGIADDYAALYYNPAGLSLVTKTELTFGIGFQRNSNSVDFSNTLTNFSANDAYISNAGLVAPFKTKAGNAAIGLGYVLESNYTNKYEYMGFNPTNTMTAYQANYGTRNYENNWAYHVWLANEDLYTPIVDSLTQSAYVQESGGLHDVIGGAAFDLSPSVSAGFNIIGKWGNYGYTRNYTETDSYNKYNEFDSVNFSNLDFNTLFVDESIKQKIFGITGSIGLQARIAEFMRIGATIKFPTYYEVNEDYSVYVRSRFDDNWEPNPYDPAEPAEIAYKITTPFTYSAGMSFYAAGITFTAGIEYIDATQLTFSDANGEEVTNIDEIRRYFDALNRDIAKELVGQVTWGVGAEWEIPKLPVVVRGSFQSTTSPYSIDVPGASNFAFALGGSIYLADNVRLDGVFRWNTMNQVRTNYGTSEYGSYYELNTNPLNVGMQITYRY